MVAVVTIAQQKGGSGKTTLAIQLAVALQSLGRQVELVDIDPQASLGGWSAARVANGGEAPLARAVAGWRLDSELRRLGGDVVVIDSPPHAETEARIAIRAADLVLVPCQPSLLDLWATKATLHLCAREGRAHLLVLNRVPPRGRALDEVRARIAADGVPLAAATLGNRTAFAAGLGQGRGVVETDPRSAAAREIQALADEVVLRLA